MNLTVSKHKDMKTVIITLILATIAMIANAKPKCQGFNNYDDKVTVIFIDDNAGSNYSVSDVTLVTYGKEYTATSVSVTVKNGVATVTLTFPYLTTFSNSKVRLRINGNKVKFKVCQ